MTSQEDYLDNLLNDMIKENISSTDEDLEEESVAEEAPEEPVSEEPVFEEPVFEETVSEETESASELEISELADLSEVVETAATFALEDLPEEDSEVEDLDVDEPNEDSVYLDAVSAMTEEEIERMLSAGENDSSEMSDVDISIDDDIEELLLDSDDSDLQEIHQLLQKDENDEVIDEDVQALFFGAGTEGLSPADQLMDEIENGEDVIEEPAHARRKEKMRKKEERAAKTAEKKAAKEAAKAEREAAKQAKRAEKVVQKKEVEFDTDVLDSIVFGAGNLGNDTETPESEVIDSAEISQGVEYVADEPANPEFADLFGDVTAGEEVQESVVAEDDLGIDLESLFGLAGENPSDNEGGNGFDLGGADATDLFGDLNDTPSDEAEVKTDTKSAKKGKEKATKEKKGIFSKLVDFLTEEEEEEPQNENIQLSAENEEIIRDLDKQKGKKKIKKKGKAAEKGDNKDVEEKPKKKAAKPKKEKKPKAEKIVVDESYFAPQSKLTFKKILPVLLLGITIGVAVMLISNISIDVIDKKTAKEAFYNGDYYTCFENLYGKELDETEEVMYGKSESILYIRLWYREYEMFAEDGLEVEALDSLIQTVEDYPMLYEYASQWNATQEVYEVYSKILAILSEKYGLSEVQAIEIADIKSDKEYSKVVTIIANGGTYGSFGGATGTQQPDVEELPDELPEESGMNQGGFIDNR